MTSDANRTKSDSQALTDAGAVKNLVPNEDIYSVSEPDRNGKVRAVVKLGDCLVLIEGRRIFEGVCT